MFWKKKKINETLLINFNTEDKRLSVRVTPAQDKPVVLCFDNQKVPVENISAGGIAFKNADFSKGDTFHGRFSLPDEDTEIVTMLKVLYITGSGVCGCRFLDLDMEDSDRIHHYVLARQKDEIRKTL